MSYPYIESPNKSSRQGHQVSGLIVHYTAGGSLNSTVRYMCNKIVKNKETGETYNANASAHYITGRDGNIVMIVPENMAAWHSGSKTTTPTLNGKKNLNLWTIGNELCNWGPLRKVGTSFFTCYNDWTYPYIGPTPIYKLKKYEPAKNYKLADGTPIFDEGYVEYWEPYPEEQISATIILWKDIVERYQITRKWIAGHEEVDPTRKIDPGPFPWSNVLDEIYPASKIEIDYTIPTDQDTLEQQNANKLVSENRNENQSWLSKCNLWR